MAEDPKEKLTDWLTGGKPQRAEADDKDRTIINSKEQIEFYYYYTMVGQATGITFFTEMARLDERLMMSFKGKRAEEVVQAMVGLDTEAKIKAGLQPEKQKKPGLADDRQL